MSGWAYLVHGETGGSQRVPDDQAVIDAMKARGWERFTLPADLDPDAANSAGDPALFTDQTEPERILTESEALELRGKDLDAALDAAGLSKTGAADDKRARLAEHELSLTADDNTDKEDNTDA